MRPVKVILFASFLYTALFSIIASTQEFPAPSVYVVKAQMKSLSPVIWATGTTISTHDSQLASEVSGRLIDIAPLGKYVKQNDVIAKIDDRQLKIQRSENQASVAKAKAQLTYQEAELKRKLSLVDKNLSAVTDLDLIRTQRDIAKNDLIVAKAQLAQTEQQLTYTQLKAPFDGVVVERLSNLGEYVNNGSAIIRLVATQQLEASVFAPIIDYQYLSEGQLVDIKSPLGQTLAPIKALIPVADERSHLMEIRLDLSALTWPVGLQVKAAIAHGKNSKVLAVPRDALIFRRDGISIFTVNNENIVSQIPVELGIASGEWIEVKGKINHGDNVIIRGSERLRAGQKVRIKIDNQTLISNSFHS